MSDCTHCALSATCIPAAFKKATLFRFTDIVATNQTATNGEVLYQQEQSCRYLYIIKSGSFKTYLTNADGSEHITAFHLPGDLVGLENISGGVTLSSASSLGNSLYCRAEYHKLGGLRKEFPALSDLAIKLYSEALQQAQNLHLCTSKQSAVSRLAMFLVLQSSRQGRVNNQKTELNLNMSRQDLASHLGLAVETISRSYSQLIQSGCIEKSNRLINILDLTLLKKFANTD